jgi:metal-responsive CopG/Arc/MetJ family transcriptional regulator
MSEVKMSKISITIPEELLAGLKELAKKEHRSVSAQIASLVERALVEQGGGK